MKIFFLVLFLSVSCSADEANDRGTNAAQVANAGLVAARNPQQAGFNAVPYLTPNSYMSIALKVIGGVLRFFHKTKMQKEFKSALSELNMRFDQLENDMNRRFDQITGFIDRKQFESDITDPTTILWGELQAYAQYPNNMTFGNMQFECMRQTAWQLAMANQYSNSSFMATKDVIMFRMFQLMMVQSFCLGVENGPDHNITDDWELSRMYNIYSALVNNTISMRIKQETDYLQAAGPGDRKTGRQEIVALHCINDQIGYSDRIAYSGQKDAGQGYQPYSVWQYNNGHVFVLVIRYWAPNDSDAIDGSAVTWANHIACGQSFDVLSNYWYCGKDTAFVGTNSNYFVNGLYYKQYHQVAYDLGFWERPITIQLLPN